MSYREREYLYNDKNGAIVQPAKGESSDERTKQQPVKLQPSWEENNLPEEELNFKNLTMDEASLQLNTPHDKYHLVYITFLIHGIGTLMPWNMFITAQNYFQNYKFAKEYIGYNFSYLPTFMQNLTFASQVPNVAFNWINIFVQLGGNLTTRIVWSITTNVIIFIVTVILAMVDTSTWPEEFFFLTMITVVILNIANGIYQNTVYGMAAKLPPKYTGAVILGNNISGTFAAIVSILSSLMTSNVRMAAIYYFITALFVLLVCFDTYFALPLNRFYRHYELLEKKEQERRKKETPVGVRQVRPYWEVIKAASPQLYNVYIVFLVTLSIFPAIQVNILRSDTNFFISDEFYVSICCFITFNVFSMIGSMLPSWFICPKKKYLWIPVTLRLLYIPFFLLCNYQITGEERKLPVVIDNDWAYWIVAASMAITNGYFSSLAMMYTPSMVEPQHSSMAGMFAGAALITGIFSGILLTYAWPWVITHVGY